MKRCIALLLVVLQLLTMVPSAVFAEEIGESLPLLTEYSEETAAPGEDIGDSTISTASVTETVEEIITLVEETVASEEPVMERAAELGTPVVASGTCGDNLTWILEGGVLTISGTGK